MSSKKLRVTATRTLPQAIEDRMADLFDFTPNAMGNDFTEEKIKQVIDSCDVLITTLRDTINAEMIKYCTKGTCRMIANFGAGTDHIDLAEAQKQGITITNTPNVLTEDTADMTMALILAAPRRLAEGVQLMREGGWSGWAPTAMLGDRISGKKLGIIGLGRIGQAVAKRAKAFGMEIHYHNRKPVHPELQADLSATYWESLDQMLARVDILTIHCPHTPATYHLLSARRLKLMRRGAYIINTARGEIVDENALTKLLSTGGLAGAALDVFEHGFKVNPRLRELPNVLLLPHMASATHESRLEMGEKVLINIQTFSDQHSPPDRVIGE